jgi:hypothetical protein
MLMSAASFLFEENAAMTAFVCVFASLTSRRNNIARADREDLATMIVFTVDGPALAISPVKVP